MNCLRCNTSNEEGATFCKHCGANLHLAFEPGGYKKTSDVLLIVFIVVAFISSIAQAALQRFVPNWDEGSTRFIKAGFWILQNLSLILVAFAIKNKSLKRIAIVIAALLIIYWAYANIAFMLGE